MRVSDSLKNRAGALMLGVAMASLVAGFALFFMQPAEAAESSTLWALAAATAIAVAAPSFIQRRACAPVSGG